MAAAAATPTALSAERRAKLDECVSILLADTGAAGDGDWRAESDPMEGVKSWSIAVPGQSLRKFKASGVIEGMKPEELAHLLWDRDQRLTWDTSYAGIDLIERFSVADAETAEAGLYRLAIHRVLTVSARDFVSLQLKKTMEDGSVVSVAFSVKDERVPEVSGFVRGEVLPGSAWRCVPVKDAEGKVTGTELFYVILTDIKGWVPTAMVNASITATFSTYYSLLRGLAAGKGK